MVDLYQNVVYLISIIFFHSSAREYHEEIIYNYRLITA